MGVCHETGHALYEFGLPEHYRSQPVGSSFGMTVHESQSLLMEMQICRSHSFMTILSEQLQNSFGAQPGLLPDNLYHHYTHVKKDFIRVDADELTYPLHIIMRYELEKKLISGECQVADLPELWNDYMQSFLGLSTLGNDKDGVMQDVHWPSGAIGYFPAYTLGAMVAAQLMNAMKKDLPDISHGMTLESLAHAQAWLNKSIHQWGSFHTFDELMKQATQRPLNSEDYLDHLIARYK